MTLSVQQSPIRPLEYFSVAADSLSVGRNSLNAISNIFDVAKTCLHAAKNTMKVVSAGVLAGGVLGVIIGPALVFEAVRDSRKAWERNDLKEGISQAEKAGVGASYSVVGGGMIVGQSAAYASLPATGAVAAAGTTMFTVGAFAMYAIVLISAIRKIGMNIAFRKELDAQDGASAQVAWLSQQVGSNESGASAEDQNKWNAFVAIVGEKCASFVKDSANKKLTESQNAHIVKEVRRASNKHFFMQGIRVAIAILGFAAVILGILLTGPFAPIVVAILFALGAMLWLVMDSSVVNERVGNLAFGKGEFTLPALEPAPPSLDLPSVKTEPSYWDSIYQWFPALPSVKMDPSYTPKSYWDSIYQWTASPFFPSSPYIAQ